MSRKYAIAAFLAMLSAMWEVAMPYTPAMYKSLRAPSTSHTKQNTHTLSSRAKYATKMALFAMPFSIAAIPDIADFRIPFPSNTRSRPLRKVKTQEVEKEVVDEGKQAARRQMTKDADLSSSLAQQFYFKNYERSEMAKEHMRATPQARLHRSCPNTIEVQYKAFAGNDCIICKGDSCELTDGSTPASSISASVPVRMMDMLSELSSHGHRTLSGSRAMFTELKKTEVDEVPMEVSWHESLSRTLSVMGIANRMDSTMNEGTNFLDVVVERQPNERLEWNEKRGMVVQLLTPNTLRANNETCKYVKCKTDALRRGGWVVVDVPALSSQTDRIAWLAVKLAGTGLWGR
eukprot:CAMPEP_0181347842 /NCGR_PEP_ID=MMETSP1101-20121128/34090_1 /TAXON_ID=46948 /ORGANISM="Rhodomonas abbreviata, Strain Caron Lab Isolate" /LENGTH=346 /DNA_ID=CAMNT_0023460075 /DNA_START=279 /DNA_END=1319 /DNA_ORIENTATION=-